MAAKKSSRKTTTSPAKRAPSTRVSSPREKLAEYRRKRDFSRTAEPSGAEAPSSAADASAQSKLRFVIQKHAASHLHFDFRLELDGVMKSWAVPKGPSYDPGTKRLAMEVEDHPISYNTFEGTIPAGEYGGGTVMLWDRGTYGAPGLSGAEGVRALREGYARGRLDLVMHGERLRGGWSLVRMRETGDKPQWLLIKRSDDTADSSRDVTAEVTTSVDSGRTMDEITAGKGKKRIWHSNREAKSSVATSSASGRSSAKSGATRGTKTGAKKPAAKKGAPKPAGSTRTVARKRAAKGASAVAVAEPAVKVHRGRPKAVRASKRLSAIVPMKASVGTGVPKGEGWTYEPKYDGIRVIAYATPDAANLVTRNGNDKSVQFPEVIDALRNLAKKAKRPLVLDGEVVALDGDEVARFQDLQSRMHTTDRAFIETAREGAPASLVAFDLLVDGDEVITGEPWTTRRARLEQRLRNRTSRALRLGETVPDDGEELLAKAAKLGWEGVIAKRMNERYVPGSRSTGWLKLKIEHRQEFVIGGWTEPRKTREHVGALLLGHYDEDGNFVYVGHTGGGFTNAGLREMGRKLASIERATSPFSERVKTNEKAHWVTPKIVVEVKFGEWTADGKLRQPIFLGVRDDKPAREVTREAESVQDRGAVRRGARAGASAAARAVTKSAKTAKRAAKPAAKTAVKSGGKRGSKRAPARITEVPMYANAPIMSRLLELETEGGRGTVPLGRGASLDVSSLDKVYFPQDGITKGALMRYYATVAPLIMPTLKDRALVLKRTPEGIDGETFFQQKAPDDPQAGVRVENVPESDGDTKKRLIGGDITTLLYCVQLGCVSTDPWHSRIQSPENPDYTYIDIDPQPKAGFQRVIDCARWAKEELDALGLNAALKTSGSRGLHIAIPLPASATWETAVTLAQIVAAQVAQKHPDDATIERAVAARSTKAVYMDYLQNIRGKSVAGAYCVRAKPGATVSTPLRWDELTDDLDPHEFTIETAPARFNKVGDLWRDHMKARNSAAALKGLARVKKR